MRLTLKAALLVPALVVSIGGLAASHPFNPDSYLQHVKFLASDELQGRGNGTPGLDMAADYIAKHFKGGGLVPAGDDGTFFQKFMLAVGSELGTGNRLTLTAGERRLEGSLGKTFVPFAVGQQTSLAGDIVFAGYGITADEYGYDDYKGLDVTDKVVLILAHEPRENDPASPFNGRELTMHAQDNTKALNARYRGARAVLIVQDPLNHPDPAGDIADATKGTQVAELQVCALRITRDLAQWLLESQSRNLAELQKQIDDSMAPRSFVLTGVQARVELDVTRIRKEVRNVVGLLPGADPGVRDELVVLGAHYDHLGRGGRSSMSPALIGQIHNGADDNASGTAGLLELASALARETSPRKRSYLFIAFAGEEIGLNGSAWWTSHPTRPLEKAVAMLNMDMIGRLRNNRLLLGGAGTSPVFPDIVKSAASEAGIEIRNLSRGGYGSSDHASFYVKNVPVLFFFSDLHSDYHAPSDDWQSIDAPGAARILSMVYGVATRLNEIDARPQFTKVDEPAVGGTVRSGTGGGGYGVAFGSVPDMAADVQGVRFSDVRPGTPAAKAGLKGGDVLVRFDGKEIGGLEDFSYMLRTHKPGDVVDVVVLRDGQPLTVQVRLEARR